MRNYDTLLSEPRMILYELLVRNFCPDCGGGIKPLGTIAYYCMSPTCRSGFLVDPISKTAKRGENAWVGYYEGETPTSSEI